VRGWRSSEKKPARGYRRVTWSGVLSLLRERWALLVLLAIMLLGGALRFYGLSVQSLWADELASWDFSEQGTL
jgi:hypothetical protein